MLDQGQCNGSYPDACVLLSALISGIAADLWPGEGFDRRRFVELWARFADPKLQPTRISVPLLRRSFQDAGRLADVTALEEARPEMFGLGNSCLVLVGDNVRHDGGRAANNAAESRAERISRILVSIAVL